MNNGIKMMRALGDWLGEERERMGFVWVGTCEADPRTPGGAVLMWGRDKDDGLHARVVAPEDEATGWQAIDEVEWQTLWPHSRVPARLADAVDSA